MPQVNQQIGQTIPKSGTYQATLNRIDGITFLIPSNAGVSSVGVHRIVSLQEDVNGNMYAVLGPFSMTYNYSAMTIVGYGVLEESLQSGGINSISPTPNTYVQGDIVTVRRGFGEVYMIDYDTTSVPSKGIAATTATIDVQGRLCGASADGTHKQVNGAIFSSVPGLQLQGQLQSGTLFYMMKDAVTP